MKYIYVKFKHIIHPCLLIAEHLVSRGEIVSFLIPNHLFEIFQEIGVPEQYEVINISDSLEIGDFPKGSPVEIILHHHHSSVDDVNALIKSMKLGSEVKYSFFADGFVNVFLDVDYVKNNIPNGKFVTAYSFDSIIPYYEKTLCCENHQIISSEDLKTIMDKFKFKEIFIRILEKIELTPEYTNLLVAIRPWGSSHFHGGNYQLNNGGTEFFNILKALLEILKDRFQNKFNLFLRGDDRDPEITQIIKSSLYSELNEFGNIIDLDDIYPADHTLDPFIYFADKVLPTPLNTVVFDSTTNLPFAGGRFRGENFIGCPLRLIDETNEIFIKHYSNKVGISYKHLLRVSSEREIEITSIDENFFSFRNKL